MKIPHQHSIFGHLRDHFTTRDLTEYFKEINQCYKKQLQQLQQRFQEHHWKIEDFHGGNFKNFTNEFIKRVEIINQLISDMEYFNQNAIQMVFNNVEKQTFLDEYK